MKKILFIVPPSKNFDDFATPMSNARIKFKNGKAFGHVVADMPLGVLSLSAYLKKDLDVDVQLIDFNVILNKIEEFEYVNFLDFFYSYLKNKKRPDIICISALFGSAYYSMLDIASVCKYIFDNVLVLVGGSVPMNMYKEIFSRTDKIDAICFGEGELPLSNFLKSNDPLLYLEKSLSWITKNKINFDKNFFKFEHIHNLDEIPFYDYSLCDGLDYSISPAITAYSAVEKKTNYHVMTSRGCIYKCTFCASHTVHGRIMRYFSMDRVKKDLLRIKNELNAELIIFQDDHFLKDKERALEIINFVKELNIKVVFQNGLALSFLDKDILVAIKKAGINQLVLPVESGSQRVLKELMKKPLKLSTVEKVIQDCRDLDIYADVNIVIGMPGETEDDFEDARKFLRSIKANWFRIMIATPLVGSEMYEICEKNGYLKESFENGHYKKGIIETKDFSAQRVIEWQHIMNLDLNFVNNYDFKIGNYKTALEGFENSIGARPDLPFAYYYASLCYKGLNNIEKYTEYCNKTKSILKKSKYWRYYFNMFGIKI